MLDVEYGTTTKLCRPGVLRVSNVRMPGIHEEMSVYGFRFDVGTSALSLVVEQFDLLYALSFLSRVERLWAVEPGAGCGRSTRSVMLRAN